MREEKGKRRKTEDALSESQDRYRIVTESVADAIVCINAIDSIYLWNKKAGEIFGYTAEEAIGKGLHDLIVPEKYQEKARMGLAHFFKTGEGEVLGKTIELTALKKDGTEFPVELSVSAMNVNGEWHSAGVIRDITERKKAEEKLKEQFDELQRWKMATVGREIRMKELKDENEMLKARIEELE